MKIRIPRSRPPDDLDELVVDAEPFASDDMSKLSTRQDLVDEGRDAQRKSRARQA